MKKFAVLLILCFSIVGFSQQKSPEQLEREARDNVREGNKLYNQLKFSEAEIAYKKALSKNPNYPKASYNLGNAVYQQQRSKEAISQFELVEKTFTEKQAKAEAYHNMGNSFMNEKQYDKAVQSYKNSLKNNPNDDETRYNLALAKQKLKEQQDKQKQDDKNKDNKDNKDKKDDKNKKDKDGDDKDKNEDKKDDKDKGKDKEDNKGDPKKPKDDKDKEQQKQQPRPNQLTPEQMKQLLEAMNNEENKTQKKLNAQKAKGKKIKQEKDW